MSLQHVICLVRLVKLNAWKGEEEKMAFEVMKNEIILYVTCMRIMNSVISSFSFQSKVYSQTMLNKEKLQLHTKQSTRSYLLNKARKKQYTDHDVKNKC